jgi:hypothetical protein
LIIYKSNLESNKLLDFKEEILQDLDNLELKKRENKPLIVNTTNTSRKLLFSITKKLLPSNYFAKIFLPK